MPTLTWRGKDAVLNHHLAVPYRLLHCEPELSAGGPGSGNLIVEGEDKGAHLIAKDQDKKAVGDRWAAATGNVFEWVTENQLPTLLETWFKRYPIPGGRP